MARLFWWWWIAIPLTAVVELGLQERIDAEVPRDAEWRAAAATVARGYRPGDLVVVAPEWASQLARTYLGDRLQPLEDVARPDASRYGRLWVVAIRGARAPEERRARPLRAWQHGRVAVRLEGLPDPARVHYDFVAKLPEARVSVVRPDGETTCPWSRLRHGIGGGRFLCDRDHEWNHVAVEVLDDLDRHPRLGIWAHPVRDATLAIEFPDVPLGERLVGWTGLRYEAAKRMAGRAVRMRVVVGGVGARELVERDRDGWRPFSIDTRPHAGRTANVRFEVRTRDPGMRHFYFAGDTRSGGPR